jgi:peptide/nickel transport system permease protein
MAKRRRILVVLALLGGIHAAVLAAGLLAPYGYAEQHRDFPYAPPMKLHFRDGRAVVFALVPEPDGRYREDPSRPYPVRFLVNGRLFGVHDPGLWFPLGADGYGRDVFSRLLYGAQVSVSTGVLAAVLSLGIGWLLGTVAGFFGGWIDQSLMRTAELFMALPWLYLLLGVRAVLPLHVSGLQAFCLVIGIIGAVGWVRPARLIRGIVLSAREREYVLTARGFGATPIYLIRRHVAPLTWGILLTQATVLIPQYIMAEVTLSFLGLGIGEPAPSWGNMLSDARHYDALVLHPWLLAPGVAAIPVLLGYFIAADILMRSDRS